MISRRKLIAAAALLAPLHGLRPALATPATGGLAREFALLEKTRGGRLGVAVLDTASGTLVSHRGNERFAMCSTFKFLLAAHVLARVDQGQELLSRRIVYPASELVRHSPVTEKYAGPTGISVGELCAATVALSDNTAANLLLDSLGGPLALTRFVRTLGDHVTRHDRREPELNVVQGDDPRDTTTPAAMAAAMRETLLGRALSPASRAQLGDWLVSTSTGDNRLRAGVPAGWRVGDKTGTGPNRETNDIAIIWPPTRAPWLIACYYVAAPGSAPGEREAVLAEVARLATRAG